MFSCLGRISFQFCSVCLSTLFNWPCLSLLELINLTKVSLRKSQLTIDFGYGQALGSQELISPALPSTRGWQLTFLSVSLDVLLQDRYCIEAWRNNFFTSCLRELWVRAATAEWAHIHPWKGGPKTLVLLPPEPMSFVNGVELRSWAVDQGDSRVAVRQCDYFQLW